MADHHLGGEERANSITSFHDPPRSHIYPANRYLCVFVCDVIATNRDVTSAGTGRINSGWMKINQTGACVMFHHPSDFSNCSLKKILSGWVRRNNSAKKR